MRAGILGSLVVLAVLSQGLPCAADDAPSPAAAATEGKSGRVNSLSPDEQRRAIRARARAAAAATAKAAPPSTAPEPAAQAPMGDVASHEAAPKHSTTARTAALPARHASRPRLSGSRKAYASYGQHSQSARHAPSTLRSVAAARGLRVGDAVPADAPLFPLPSRYGPRPVYRESAIEPGGTSRYAPYRPDLPPFPGVED
jgi:hypothetical protein